MAATSIRSCRPRWLAGSRPNTPPRREAIEMRLPAFLVLLMSVFALSGGFLGSAAFADAPPDPANWRQLDPENTLYIDTAHGRIVVEMYPEVAPRHVERIKTLTRAHFYDGLLFHRVVDDFMAQTGDPLGTGEGASTLPDLHEEF